VSFHHRTVQQRLVALNVGHPQLPGRVSGPEPGIVVRGPLAREMRRSPAVLINRWTVQRATR
jgi:hypothetical protein